MEGNRGGTKHPHHLLMGRAKAAPPCKCQGKPSGPGDVRRCLSPTWSGDLRHAHSTLVSVPLTNFTVWPWSQEQDQINRICHTGPHPLRQLPGHPGRGCSPGHGESTLLREENSGKRGHHRRELSKRLACGVSPGLPHFQPAPEPSSVNTGMWGPVD